VAAKRSNETIASSYFRAAVAARPRKKARPRITQTHQAESMTTATAGTVPGDRKPNTSMPRTKATLHNIRKRGRLMAGDNIDARDRIPPTFSKRRCSGLPDLHGPGCGSANPHQKQPLG